MNIDIKNMSSQLMHLEVHPTLGTPFACSFVYTHTDKRDRVLLFSQLEEIARSCSGPWLVLGDFNCVANSNKRIGNPVRLSKVLPLRNCLSRCGLHDMKCNGRFYTLTNKQMGINRVLSIINRAL